MPPESRIAQCRLWLVFAASALGSAYLHELGHCIPAWAHGYPAVPTPAKEYLLVAVTDQVQQAIALGGILATVLAVLGAMLLAGAPSTGVAQTPPPGTFEVIKVAQLNALIRKGAPAQIIDVRSKPEYLERHIKGAVSISLDTLEARAGEVPRQGLVVVYCACPHHLASLAYAFDPHPDGRHRPERAGDV